MLKRLFLIWIFSGSLDGISQVADTTIPLREYNWSAAKAEHTSEIGQALTVCRIHNVISIRCPYCAQPPDTLRAELLVTYTTRRWGIAHARDGYVVKKDGKVIRFLTDKKERFPPNTRLWGWVSNDEKILP